MPSTEKAVRKQRIDRDMKRGMLLMGGLSESPELLKGMMLLGYTEEDHQLGLDLLLELIRRRLCLQGMPDLEVIHPKEALKALLSWINKNIGMARGTLEHLHGEQEEYVFKDLDLKNKIYSCPHLYLFLARIRTLWEGTDPDRSASREADRAAIGALRRRNILGDEIEAHLLELLEAVKGVDYMKTAYTPDETACLEAAERFRTWLKEWRAVARQAFPKRHQQIRLGLARRRRGKKKS